jgi:hypothetical protein
LFDSDTVRQYHSHFDASRSEVSLVQRQIGFEFENDRRSAVAEFSHHLIVHCDSC